MAVQAIGNEGAAAGKQQFDTALPHTNGRACATCHIESDHFGLTPAHVQALALQSPSDPIFHRIDADDPDAEVLAFDHLKAGLIRVTVKLADNLDVIDINGNVITNADRTISVWRGVPSIDIYICRRRLNEFPDPKGKNQATRAMLIARYALFESVSQKAARPFNECLCMGK